MRTSDKIKAIANTLETLDIKATGENVSKMTGIYTMLNEVIKDIMKQEETENDAPETE